jgi:hypothetical protein
MFGELLFRIWILFEIWVLGFGILEPFRKGKPLLSELAIAGFDDVTLIFAALVTNTSRGIASGSTDTAEDNNSIRVYLCSPTTGKFRGFLI